jgi:hypothetical protein
LYWAIKCICLLLRMQAMTSMPEGSQQQLQLQVVQLQQRVSELEQEQQQLQADLARHAALNAGLQSKLSDRQQQQQQLSPVKEEQEAAASTAAGGVAVKPIKTQRSVDANSPALLPSTPGSEKVQPRGAFYSSDGGGSNSSSGGAAAGRSQHGSSSNRKPSRLSSASGAAAAAAGQRPGSGAAAAARQSSRPSSAEPVSSAPAVAAEQHELQRSQAGALTTESSDGATSSKPGGVSYASQQWEESKQLQARIDSLRCVLELAFVLLTRIACCA